MKPPFCATACVSTYFSPFGLIILICAWARDENAMTASPRQGAIIGVISERKRIERERDLDLAMLADRPRGSKIKGSSRAKLGALRATPFIDDT